MRNKTCVVTGSSRGIGKAIAQQFGEEGWEVVVNYRSSRERAEETAAHIEEQGGSALIVQADVTDFEAIKGMREQIQEVFGQVDVLVNNAGVNQDIKFSEMSHEDWDTVLDVHLDGAFHTTQTFFDDLAESEEGRLINISSIIGKGGNYGQANYATAKSGIFGFTRTIALELAPHESTANCVAPGFIKTDMVEELPEPIKDQIKDDTPLDRLGTPEEIAEIVHFLASDRSSFITGEVIDANGGKDL
jgi:3-oxoacyl-[acyl-carrier protein] reductase